MGYILLDLLKNEPKLLFFVYEVECPKFNIRYPRKNMEYNDAPPVIVGV